MDNLDNFETHEPIDLREQSYELEELLATDSLFVDYLNVFLHLPTFPRSIHYYKNTGRFYICSDKSKQQIELERTETILWLKKHRLLHFLDSDCYHEYRLAKLLSQASSSDSSALNQTRLTGRYTQVTCRRPANEINDDHIRKKYVGGDSETSQNRYNCPVHENCSGCPLAEHFEEKDGIILSKAESNGTTDLPSNDIPNDSSKSNWNSKTSIASKSETELRNHDKIGLDVKLDNYFIEENQNSAADSLSDKRNIRVLVQSDSEIDETYLENNNNKPVQSKIFHVGNLCVDYPEWLLYEGCRRCEVVKNNSENRSLGKTSELFRDGINDAGKTNSENLNQGKTNWQFRNDRPFSVGAEFSLESVNEVKSFLKGTSGEKLWCIWMDVERARAMLDLDDLINHLVGMRQRYLNAGCRLTLGSDQLARWRLSDPNNWTLEHLTNLQPLIVLPLLNYWMPRHLQQQKHAERNLLSTSTMYQDFTNISNTRQMETHPTHPVPSSIPHRPKSCRPIKIDERVDSGFYSSSIQADPDHVASRAATFVKVLPTVTRERSTVSSHVRSMRQVDVAGSYGSQVSGYVISRAASRVKQQNGVSNDAINQSGRQLSSAWNEDSLQPPSRECSRFTTTTRSSSVSSMRLPSTLTHHSTSTRQIAPHSSTSTRKATQGGRKKIRGVKSDRELVRERRVREVDRLLQALDSESRAGRVFRKYIHRSNNKLWLNSLKFWEHCQQYHAVFYQPSFDVLLLQKNAKYIYSLYLCLNAPYSLDTPLEVVRQIERCLTPAYEELFDSVEEQAIDTLLEAWSKANNEDAAALQEIERVGGAGSAIKGQGRGISEYDQLTGLLRLGGAKGKLGGKAEVDFDQSEFSIGPKGSGKSLTDRHKTASINFADFSLAKVLGWREELENFKKFLDENSASIDLHCWIDIEAWKEVEGDETEWEREKRAEDIKQLYLNERYFFGENSPAGQQGQLKVLAAGGSLGKLEDLRPTELCLLETQRYVQQRLEYKWLPLFLMSDGFQQRQQQREDELQLTRPISSACSVLDDVMVQRSKGHDGSSKHSGKKYMPSQEKILALRKALMNPVTSAQLARYLAIKAGHLENNIYFWQEVQKYKDISHMHSDKALLQQKISAVIRRFIESHIPPSIQISIDQETADKIISSRNQPTAYIFREAQAKVFLDLLPWWDEFVSYKDKQNLPNEELLAQLERRKRKMKLNELKKARQLEEAALKEKANKKATILQAAELLSDHASDGRVSADSRLAALAMLRPYYWTYSQYLQALRREAELNNQLHQSDDSIQSEEESFMLIDMKGVPSRAVTKRSTSGSQRTTSISSERFTDEWSRRASMMSKKSIGLPDFRLRKSGQTDLKITA